MGGGAAAAWVGAVATALTLKVVRIVLSRPGISGQLRRGLHRDLKRLKPLLKKLKHLVQEDSKGYAQFVVAVRQGRRVTLARRQAVKTPLRICQSVAQVSHVIQRLSPRVGAYLRSDLKAASFFLRAAFQAAQAMIEVNLQWK